MRHQRHSTGADNDDGSFDHELARGGNPVTR
jgi:hypothetical protein